MTLQWRNTVVLASGFALGIYPEISVSIFTVLGVYLVLTSPHFRSPLIIAILAMFTLSRIIFYIQGHSWWLGIVEGLVVVSIVQVAAWFQQTDLRLFVITAMIGFACSLVLALSQSLGFMQTPQSWDQSKSKATWLTKNNTDFVLPGKRNPDNAWIIRDLGTIGAGRIRYDFLLRAKKLKNIEIFLNHSGITGNQIHNTCQIRPTWTQCSISAVLSTRASGLVGLGGYQSWTAKEGGFEVRILGLRNLDVPLWLDRLRFTSRGQGFTFNPNAFGALSVVIAVLGLTVFSSPWIVSIAVLEAVGGVFISGSRNAIIAMLACISTYIFTIDRSYMVKTVSMFSILSLLFFSLWVSGGKIRFIDFQDEINQTPRNIIILKAIQTAINNPISGYGLDSSRILNAKILNNSHGYTKITHSHNLLSQSFLEQGLLGLSLIMTILCSAFFTIWKQKNKGLLLALILVCCLNTIDYLFFFAPLQILLWLFWQNTVSLSKFGIQRKMSKFQVGII
jgi:hypothetical protein